MSSEASVNIRIPAVNTQLSTVNSSIAAIANSSINRRSRLTKKNMLLTLDTSISSGTELATNLIEANTDPESLEVLRQLPVENTWIGDPEDSDSDSLDLDEEHPDYLRFAGAFTDAEICRLSIEKLERLQTLYTRQKESLKKELKASKLGHCIEKDLENLVGIPSEIKCPSDPEELKAYRELCALKNYKKIPGPEKLIAAQVEPLVEDPLYPTVVLSPLKCASRICSNENPKPCSTLALPSARYCLKHIMQEQKQVLFQKCTGNPKCHNPVWIGIANTSDIKCLLHSDTLHVLTTNSEDPASKSLWLSRQKLSSYERAHMSDPNVFERERLNSLSPKFPSSDPFADEAESVFPQLPHMPELSFLDDIDLDVPMDLDVPTSSLLSDDDTASAIERCLLMADTSQTSLNQTISSQAIGSNVDLVTNSTVNFFTQSPPPDLSCDGTIDIISSQGD